MPTLSFAHYFRHGTPCRGGSNSPSILEGVPEGRGSNIKHQKSPIEHIQLSDSSNGLSAIADAPTPAYGHPFPKEGELSFGRSCLLWPELSSHFCFFLLFLLTYETSIRILSDFNRTLMGYGLGVYIIPLSWSRRRPAPSPAGTWRGGGRRCPHWRCRGRKRRSSAAPHS